MATTITAIKELVPQEGPAVLHRQQFHSWLDGEVAEEETIEALMPECSLLQWVDTCRLIHLESKYIPTQLVARAGFRLTFPE